MTRHQQVWDWDWDLVHEMHFHLAGCSRPLGTESTGVMALDVAHDATDDKALDGIYELVKLGRSVRWMASWLCSPAP